MEDKRSVSEEEPRGFAGRVISQIAALDAKVTYLIGLIEAGIPSEAEDDPEDEDQDRMHWLMKNRERRMAAMNGRR